MLCTLPTLPTSRVRWMWLQAIISKLYAVISLESHFRAWGRWHSEIWVCQNKWVSWYPMGIKKVIRRKLHRVNIEVLLRSYIFRLSGKLLDRHMGYLLMNTINAIDKCMHIINETYTFWMIYVTQIWMKYNKFNHEYFANTTKPWIWNHFSSRG